VAALLGMTCSWACSIYDSSLLGDGGADAAADASADAPPEASDAGCVRAELPARPAADDPSDADVEIVFAVRSFVFDGPDGGAPPLIGYDLDGLCTCPDPEACVAAQSGATHCDDPGGRDNGGARLLRTFESLSGGDLFSQQVIDDGLDGGAYGMLVRVRNYNGKPNDTQVEVSSFVSDGVAGPDGGTAPPQWNGNDPWIVDKSGVFGSGSPIVPLHSDPQGYVSNGVLVGSFDYPLPIGFSTIDRLDVLLAHGFVTGTLTPSGSGWRIDDGVAGGRWAIGDALSQLAYVHDPANDSNYLCPSTNTYGQIELLLCPSLDITSAPNAPTTTTCDALSFALGFSAESAQLGPVVAAPRPTTCADAGPYACP
jgi:hypothetical protein